MKLPEWARGYGVSRQGATWWLRAWVLPVPARELAAGMIVAGVPGRGTDGVVVCARVSSCGQGGELGWQVARLAERRTVIGIALSEMALAAASTGRAA